MMKVQEILENYNIYKTRITMAKVEIEELKNEILDIKSSNLDGMQKTKGYVESNIDNFIAEKQEKINKKQRYLSTLQFKIRIVEDLVKILKKYNQDVIEMRYYAMMSIEEIATKKERSYWSIQKTINNSLEKMQEEYEQNKKV